MATFNSIGGIQNSSLEIICCAKFSFFQRKEKKMIENLSSFSNFRQSHFFSLYLLPHSYSKQNFHNYQRSLITNFWGSKKRSAWKDSFDLLKGIAFVSISCSRYMFMIIILFINAFIKNKRFIYFYIHVHFFLNKNHIICWS